MILKAREEFDLDLSQSVLIGDKETDLQAGRKAGIPENNLHLFCD
jgi:D-glycero-D-manno-heptose 1,7-bisphosphate phosphatase